MRDVRFLFLLGRYRPAPSLCGLGGQFKVPGRHGNSRRTEICTVDDFVNDRFSPEADIRAMSAFDPERTSIKTELKSETDPTRTFLALSGKVVAGHRGEFE